MTYRDLIAEHDAIDTAAGVLVTLAKGAVPAPAAAVATLEIVAQQLRDHLAGEDVALYQTLVLARGSRHAATAQRLEIELEALKEDWTTYLYRWDALAIADDWPAFAADTVAMLDRIQERVAFETMILYSLALHFGVVTLD